MTMRVTVEIVPFGDETQKRTIGIMNIHNVHHYGLGVCAYEVERTDIRHDGTKEFRNFPVPHHARQDGPWELVRKATAIEVGHEDPQ